MKEEKEGNPKSEEYTRESGGNMGKTIIIWKNWRDRKRKRYEGEEVKMAGKEEEERW